MRVRLWLAGLVCGLVLSAHAHAAVDRNAFTFTRYDLTVETEPEQQRLSVRGTVTLRNDSASPQKNAVLQISSGLTWRSIRAGDEPVQFVTQPYTSDIDHTGELSEAIVTLPKEVPPGGSVELNVGYEGVIILDATRLTRIGIPEANAFHSDWDQIGKRSGAVRGVGYVAWYPVAMEAANLSQGNSLFATLARWKLRSAATSMLVHLCAEIPSTGSQWSMLMNEPQLGGVGAGGMSGRDHDPNVSVCSEHMFEALGTLVPTFAAAPYETLAQQGIVVYFIPSRRAQAQAFVQAAEKATPFVTEWLGVPRSVARVVELADAGASPFEAGAMLLTPLNDTDPQLLQIAMVHELSHAALSSPRPWIAEGLAHFLQAVYREQQAGRAASLDFMGLHRTAVAEAEKAAGSDAGGKTDAVKPSDETALISTSADEFIRSKAAYVWWMLRDMLGDEVLKKALAQYHASDDKDPKYLQSLLEKESKRDLQWFFDDWVYHDRGLPDFKIAAVFPRPITEPNYVTTVTVENAGGAGAEVPLTVRFSGGDITKKIKIAGHDKTVVRVETQGRPSEVTVNDGSVPESNVENNTYRIEAAK